ncbi:MAG: alcohol dehydrogenase catalytic domain-containing protein, partial [Prolixibacteraceae bacterium]|nr:alcohol dehydrogenase catalytic domain-containing protein [Prolixibacteraceae bacterium]
MKSIKLTGIRQMKMVEVPDVKIKSPNEVKIRMVVMGVCGSDIHYYTSGKIGTQVVKFPFTVGHEGAGEVIEVGESVTRVKPGDRIAIEPAMPCFKCDQCRQGRSHTCRNLRFLGNPGQAEGLLSEYIVMPETSCHKIPENLTYDDAAITEPLAIGVYAVQQAGNVMSKNIGILGAGPIGESVLLPALAEGAAKVFVTDKIDERLVLAEKNGAEWTGNPLKKDVVGEIIKNENAGLDIVFECCGQQEALDQALLLLKPGGKLMVIGIPEENRISFDINHLRHKEITIV